MADFSKEYVEITGMWGGTSWDFSLEKEFKHLKNNHSLTIICEGFGITAIGKDEKGKREVRYKGEWIDYEKFIEHFKEKLDSSSK